MQKIIDTLLILNPPEPMSSLHRISLVDFYAKCNLEGITDLDLAEQKLLLVINKINSINLEKMNQAKNEKHKNPKTQSRPKYKQ